VHFFFSPRGFLFLTFLFFMFVCYLSFFCFVFFFFSFLYGFFFVQDFLWGCFVCDVFAPFHFLEPMCAPCLKLEFLDSRCDGAPGVIFQLMCSSRNSISDPPFAYLTFVFA